MEMPEPEDADIRSLIVKLMETLDLNQKQFSAAWGVSEATVSKLLSGEQRDVTLSQAKRLAKAFRFNPRLLFREPDEPES